MADEKRDEAAALSHARECWKFHAETRNKHFHYFVIITAALIVGAATGRVSGLLVGLAGIVFVAAFYVLDRREHQLLEDAKIDMDSLEAEFSLRVHQLDKTDERKAKRKWISTTRAYRSMYVVSAAFFTVVLCSSVVPYFASCLSRA